MTLNKAQVTEYRRLRDSGVDVTKHNQIRFNAGSETAVHACSKLLAGFVGQANGYRVDSEVSIETPAGTGECDVLLWGHPDRLTYAVEIEHAITEETKEQKRTLYVDNTEIDDLIMIEANDIPPEMLDAGHHIADQIGLEL